MPIIPFWIEMWVRGLVMTIATIATAAAPRRSDQGARLKNIHQTANDKAPGKSANDAKHSRVHAQELSLRGQKRKAESHEQHEQGGRHARPQPQGLSDRAASTMCVIQMLSGVRRKIPSKMTGAPPLKKGPG